MITDRDPQPHPKARRPSKRSLTALSCIASIMGIQAVFQWLQLVKARAGELPYCRLTGTLDCAAVWDSQAATHIHNLTQIPVAGWGVIWALVAGMLPPLALWLRRRGQPFDHCLTAIRLTAIAAAAVCLFLIGVSLSVDAWCMGCLFTYLLAFTYAGIALYNWRDLAFPQPIRAVTIALLWTLFGFALTIYPGRHTPLPVETGHLALIRLPPEVKGPPMPLDAGNQWKTFLASLSDNHYQTLARAVTDYRNQRIGPLPPPRAVRGNPGAPVRITTFMDIRCRHCAELHQTLEGFYSALPRASFCVETRHYPLDGHCNPWIGHQDGGLACLVAKAQICMEGRPDAAEFSRLLFESRDHLDTDKVWDLAAHFTEPKVLQACIASQETNGKLRADLSLARAHHLTGTPLIVVNGRKASRFAPFLYALILTRGELDHPLFEKLARARP